MDAAAFSRLRVPLTLAVALAYTSLLVWQHLHGGVPGHSFLARDDMPATVNTTFVSTIGSPSTVTIVGVGRGTTWSSHR